MGILIMKCIMLHHSMKGTLKCGPGLPAARGPPNTWLKEIPISTHAHASVSSSSE